MQVQNALTLFDYIGNSASTDSAFEQAIARQNSDIGGDIKNLQQEVSSGDVDATLERLQSGEGTLSLQTLNNMLNFNLIKVSRDLQQVAADLGISAELDIIQVDGKWQVQQEQNTNPAALSQFQAYIDHNKTLQSKLDTMNKLSEMYELGNTQQYAKQLQDANISEAEVVDFLSHSRDYLFGLDRFTLSSAGLSVASEGQSQSLFDQAKQDFGLSEQNISS